MVCHSSLGYKIQTYFYIIAIASVSILTGNGLERLILGLSINVKALVLVSAHVKIKMALIPLLSPYSVLGFALHFGKP